MFRTAVSLVDIPHKNILRSRVYEGVLDDHGFYVPSKRTYLSEYILRPKTKKLNKIQLFFRKLGM